MYCDDAVMIADNKKILDAATGLKKVELYKQLQETDSVLWSYNQRRGSGEHSHEWTDGRYKRQWWTQRRVERWAIQEAVANTATSGKDGRYKMQMEMENNDAGLSETVTGTNTVNMLDPEHQRLRSVRQECLRRLVRHMMMMRRRKRMLLYRVSNKCQI